MKNNQWICSVFPSCSLIYLAHATSLNQVLGKSGLPFFPESWPGKSCTKHGTSLAEIDIQRHGKCCHNTVNPTYWPTVGKQFFCYGYAYNSRQMDKEPYWAKERGGINRGNTGRRTREGEREKVRGQVVGPSGFSSYFPFALKAATQWINSSAN